MDPFIGEIRAFPFSYAPMDWAECNGQQLPIAQYSALYAIIGTAFGGDGRTYFNLPNLQGKTPLGVGSGPNLTPRGLGQTPGSATVNLTSNNFPPHSHALNGVAASDADQAVAADHFFGKSPASGGRTPVPNNAYQTQIEAGKTLAADVVQVAGQATGNVSHSNLQPYLPVILCICTAGIFPVRS